MTEYRRGLEAAKKALHEATEGIKVDEHTVVSIVGVCWRAVQRLINKDDDDGCACSPPPHRRPTLG